MFVAFIRVYQKVMSPLLQLLGAQCRFYPSCSAYALQSFERYSSLKACQLTARRIMRCHPGCEGGFDPVP